MNTLSRRGFLKLAGATVAINLGGALLSCSSTETPPPPGEKRPSGPPAGMPGPRAMTGLDTFDHVVVLMLENRSFDNLLGYLYQPGQVPNFEGVAGKYLTNPIPAYADQSDLGVLPVCQGFVMDAPNPDPGEPYPHTNTQLFNTVLPESNRFVHVRDMQVPYNRPDVLPIPAPMSGFLTDYINAFQTEQQRPPTLAEYSQIMSCFPPNALPAINGLAAGFAVCDHWHCDVPTETYPNRSFFHAASSSGFVINGSKLKWLEHNTAETLFDRLSAKGLSWKIYFSPVDLVSLTGLIHWPRLKGQLVGHFCHLEQFYTDAANGNLPHYSFLEPSMMVFHNDMHPPSNVLPGDKLINDVYEAIRRSNSPKGSNYRNTLLIVTFDEHGGCFDHVAPPSAPSPNPAAPPGELGFRFDRLGVRVPTILVSAYIDASTVLSTPLQATSVIKTLSQKWGLGSLTQRDQLAPDFAAVFNRTSPRVPAAWPVLKPRPAPDVTLKNAHLLRPLNGLQRDIVDLVSGLDHLVIPPEVHTVGQALEHMQAVLSKVKISFGFCSP